MDWLIEANVFQDGNPERLVKIVRDRGMKAFVIPFESPSDQPDELRPAKPILLASDATVFCYGSMNLMQWLWKRGSWSRMAWYDFCRFRCQTYYAYWGEFLLQQQYCLLPLAEIARRRDWLFEVIGDGQSVFVRPDDNTKTFSGGLIARDKFDQWFKRAMFYDPAPDSLAIVAKPQTLLAEWRVIIAQKRAITASLYRERGVETISDGCTAEVSEFAERVAGSTAFDPHPMYALDIAETTDGLRVIEIGSVCCASLYACDLEKIADEVLRIAEN